MQSGNYKVTGFDLATHFDEDMVLNEKFNPTKPVTAVYLDEILVECVRAVGSLAEKRKIKFDFLIPVEMPLEGDETLLHRLFLNLLDNAIKYNREGGTISIAVETVDKTYRVSVADTGAGIAIEDQAKIFDRFYRSDKSRTRDNTNGKNGVGLGLSIAVWIAEVHHGTLTLQESDENGSVFQVELPRAEKIKFSALISHSSLVL